jgi:outer membrane beta-barrel protein
VTGTLPEMAARTMRTAVFIAAVLCLPSAAVAADDDESPARVQVVQKRQYSMKHELTVAAGFLPLDAFYKGVTVNLAYTYHFVDAFAWRVARGTLSRNLDTGLRTQLQSAYGVQTTDFPEVAWMLGSDVMWNAFYGKQAFMNLAVLHMALFFVLGGDAVKTQTEVRPAINFGGGLRFFASDWLSIRVEGTNHFVVGKKAFNVVDLQLGLAVNLGG